MQRKSIVILGAALALITGCSGVPEPHAVAPAPALPPTVAEPRVEARPMALPPNITVAQAAALRDAGAFMLDVREPFEWQEYRMPGAALIPLGQLPRRLNEVPRDRPIVVVCRSGNRSQVGRDILLQAGFAAVTSMDGGMRAWRSAGLPVTQ